MKHIQSGVESTQKIFGCGLKCDVTLSKCWLLLKCCNLGNVSFVAGVLDEYSELWYVPQDGKKMTTMSYANGPGGLEPGQNRTDPNPTDTGRDYVFIYLVMYIER